MAFWPSGAHVSMFEPRTQNFSAIRTAGSREPRSLTQSSGSTITFGQRWKKTLRPSGEIPLPAPGPSTSPGTSAPLTHCARTNSVSSGVNSDEGPLSPMKDKVPRHRGDARPEIAPTVVGELNRSGRFPAGSNGPQVSRSVRQYRRLLYGLRTATSIVSSSSGLAVTAALRPGFEVVLPHVRLAIFIRHVDDALAVPFLPSRREH